MKGLAQLANIKCYNILALFEIIVYIIVVLLLGI